MKKVLAAVLALFVLATLFAGCKKDGPTEDTTEPKLNLNLDESSAPTETEPEPTETTVPPTTEPPPEPETVVSTATISSQGDLLMHSPVFATAKKSDGSYDF